MNLLRWIRRALSPEHSTGEPDSTVYALLLEAHARLVAEEYDEARSTLFQALKLRNDIKDPTTIDYLLASLETT
jgi:hypothetical protein